MVRMSIMEPGYMQKTGMGRKTPWGYTVRAGKHKGFCWTKGQRPQPFRKCETGEEINSGKDIG